MLCYIYLFYEGEGMGAILTILIWLLYFFFLQTPCHATLENFLKGCCEADKTSMTYLNWA